MATTYYVDDATGLDTDTGLTEALAFQTIQKAADTVTIGDTVYVKNTNNYLEMVTLTQAGQSTNPVAYIGYETTIGDNGMVTIDGEATRASGFTGTMNYNYFVNFTVFDTTGVAFNLGFADYEGFYNCHALDCSGKGFIADDYCQWHECSAINCSEGIDAGRYSSVWYSTMADNTTYGYDGTDNVGNNLVGCIFYGNGTYDARCSYGTNFDGCTFDGENPAGTKYAIYSTSGPHNITNCIFYDCDIGIHVTGYMQCGGGNNCFFSNDTDITAATWSEKYNPDGNITADPDFTDAAAHDYTLKSTSPCIGAGRGGYRDIGALQYDWSGDTGGGQVVIAG